MGIHTFIKLRASQREINRAADLVTALTAELTFHHRLLSEN